MNQEQKPKYETPIVMPLGEMAVAEGGNDKPKCNAGSAIGHQCKDGGRAFTICKDGGTAGASCDTGDNPHSNCHNGNNANSACNTGGNAFIHSRRKGVYRDRRGRYYRT